MTWNYRIVEYKNGTGFGLHEVHYNKDGEPISMTDNPAAFVGASREVVYDSLVRAKMDAMRRPVLQDRPEWD